MPFPIIPILAIAAILGGTATAVWYYDQPQSKRDQANRLALKWFGRRFQELSDRQQEKIEDHIDG